MSSQTTPAPVRARPPVARESWNTLDRLRFSLLALWIADALFYAAIFAGGAAFSGAIKTIGRDAAPSIIAAQHIKTAIAGMDARTVSELLGKPGQTPQEVLAYESYRLEAGKALIAAAENVVYGDAERAPILALQIGLSTFSARIQRALDLHASGLQMDPITLSERIQRARDPHARNWLFLNAYRQAADVMDQQLYPAADALDKANRDALDRIYADQIRRAGAVRAGVLIVGGILMFALLAVQGFLTRRTRRIFNPALLMAAGVALVVLIYSLSIFGTEMYELKAAKSDAFASMDALWRARALAYAASSDQARYLLDDERSAQWQAAFDVKVKEIALKYLGAELNNITFAGEHDAATRTSQALDDYLRIDQQVRKLRQSSNLNGAIELALGNKEGQSRWALQRFDEALGETLGINQAHFDAAVQRGEKGLRNFQTSTASGCLVIGGLALLGLIRRIQEYR